MAEAKEAITIKLDGNYVHWKVRLRTYLGYRDCLEAIEMDLSISIDEALRKKDKRALNLIFQCLNDSDLSLVSESTSAFQAWTTIKDTYEESSGAVVHSKLVQWLNSRVEAGTVKNDIVKFSLLTNEIESLIGARLPEAFKTHALIAKLPKELDSITSGFITTKLSDLLFNNVKNSAISKDIPSTVMDESRGLAFGGRFIRGRGSSRFNNRGIRSNMRSEKIVCFNCGGDGHFARGCDKPKSNVLLSTDETVNKSSEQYPCLPSSVIATMSNGPQQARLWVLDSGASDHHIVNKSLLVNSQRCSSFVTGATGNRSQVIAIGQLNLRCRVNKDVKNLRLMNVRLAPNLFCNLISVGRLVENGAEVLFRENKALVYRGGETILVANQNVNGLYEIVLSNVQSSNCTDEVALSLWHEKLGHPGGEVTRMLRKQFPTLDLTEQSTCDTCLRSKLKQLPYSSNSARATKPLELVHTDVCGPINPAAFDGNRYFVVFVDDFSKFCVVYLLKERAMVFECFKEFKNFMEVRLNTRIKSLMSDNGGEYVSSEFETYLKENGIDHVKSVPYCHAQNGRAERMIQKVQQEARSLLIHSKLPTKYWSLAVLTAAYLINKLPSTVTNQIPYQLIFGK